MLTGATLQRTAQRAQRVVEQAEHDGCYTWCGGEMDRGGDGQGLFSARLVRDDDDNDDVGWGGWVEGGCSTYSIISTPRT